MIQIGGFIKKELDKIIHAYCSNRSYWERNCYRWRYSTIGEVSSPHVLNGEKSALIYADNVINADGINRVWVVITPPNYSSSSPDIPVVSLPFLDLSPAGDGIYAGTYDSFIKKGNYNISVYASDTKGLISLPVSSKVTQQKGI